MSNSKNKKEKRKKQAIEMLASGLNQNEVSKKINVTRQTISNWMKNDEFKNQVEKLKYKNSNNEQILPEKLNSIPKSIDNDSNYEVKSREFYFQKELEFLYEIQNAILPHLKEGSVRAANVLLKLSERRSKLLALDVRQMSEYEAIVRLIEGNILPVEIQKQILPVFENCETGLKNIFDSKYQNTKN